jgi:hypothetical protein
LRCSPTTPKLVTKSAALAARKVRVAGRGKGESGGYRVITFYSGKDVPVFLLAVYSKSEKANLSKAERNELKGILADIVREYRKEAKRHV